MSTPRQRLRRSYYSNPTEAFLSDSDEQVLGILTQHSEFAVEDTQRNAWLAEMALLRRHLPSVISGFNESEIHFEFSIPRMGRRIDVVVIIGGIVFVLEFKVGERQFPLHAIDQVVDYALDLKNFHEGSHRAVIAPVLISTQASAPVMCLIETSKHDQVLKPLTANADGLGDVMRTVLDQKGNRALVLSGWSQSRYCPTPTIIEAATALYSGHHVEDISRSDAGATNLAQTSSCIEQVIAQCSTRQEKAICFVTGVPGAGKTLVGLNIATRPASEQHSVFLSGNGPLVKILHEALARDSREAIRDMRISSNMRMSFIFHRQLER
jgi:hypothetical protein